MTVEDALRELEDLLPGMNYVVAFDLRRVPPIPGGTPKQYVTAAYGPKAKVGGFGEVSADEMRAAVEECIRWPGESGTYPDEDAIRSPRLGELVGVVLAHLDRAAAGARGVWSFRFDSGHPFYPVQWDFAYVLVGAGGAEVFVGSSSD